VSGDVPPSTVRADLRADCARCFGLCCVVPAFVASTDFAIDKPAGQPCPHLRQDSRCGIHANLRDQGFPGCTVYDCLGAGQRIAQITFGGRDWRSSPELAQRMFAAFPVMRELHELLWYLSEAIALPAAGELRGELERALAATEVHAAGDADALLDADVASHRGRVGALLLRASELARAEVAGVRVERRGADLIGKNLRGAAFRGASLRGAYLIGADLRGADLRLTDLLGADLRGADVCGTDLSESLFLTQFQVNAARGDARTALPAALTRPAHWT
jgi:hypothetical protein